MRRTAQLLLFVSLILVPVLIGQGMDIGAKFGTQTSSLVIQAEWDISPNLTMTIFLEPQLGSIVNPATAQTPSFTIGLIGKYRFPSANSPFVPYLGLGGSLKQQGPETTIAIEALAGTRFYLASNLYLFAEAAFSIFFPITDVANWYKDLYLGFAFRL